MKVVLIAALTAGAALASLQIFDAAQVPAVESLFGQGVSWLEGEANALAARIGVKVFAAERGEQLASPGDWIVGDAGGVHEVLGDDAFKAKYAAAPDGAGVPATAPANQTDALPQYRSHKIVRAAPIVSFTGPMDDNPGMVVLDVGAQSAFSMVMPRDAFIRYTPVEGDYLVVYDDGYLSVSPKAAFEDGYSLVAADPDPAAPGAIQQAA